MFSADVLSTIEKYSTDVAEHVMERAQKICKDFADVSMFFLLLHFFFLKKIEQKF